MKRIPILVTMLVMAFSLSAEEAEVRTTWLVATKAPAEIMLDARADLPEIGHGGNRAELRSRTISRFRYVNGFAAQLTESEARELAKSPLVRWVEPNHSRVLLSPSGDVPALGASTVQEIPFGISMIGAPAVWPATRGRSVKVGVLDTGVDRTHPDLVGRYAGGYDFVNDDDDPQDDHGHGTHVSGTIAANDNDLGVVGVAPEARLYGLKVLDEHGSGTVLNLIEGVEWAIANDLDILNMSLGSPDSSLLEKEAFVEAERAGIIAVAASGNAYYDAERIDYPANYASVVAVGAVDVSETVASFSQRGGNLDFVAPGVGVISTTYSTFYGITTSLGQVFRAERMDFSPWGRLSGELVDCGLGRPGECPPNVAGNVALIQRGELTFADKSNNAKAAGAKGAIIYNHHPDDAPEGGVVRGTLGSLGQWILTIGTSRSTGEVLLSLADRNVDLGETTASDYSKLNGTSMATPHVTGAITLLKALAPSATKFQLLETLRATAKDLGEPGRDTTFGYGRIDVDGAAHQLAPEAFTADDDTRRRSIRRPRAGG